MDEVFSAMLTKRLTNFIVRVKKKNGGQGSAVPMNTVFLTESLR
jgi:hypothetical protein